ncbi:NAD(P)H-dependent oxidoreductase [Anaeromicropila herbilytica]|uniref:NAD(P)H dehydrogenase n=1 Tax=Anaeromicropila herbilytica TaxID=2785025 RepID=A0A7R7IBC1_9FIRM|nr:NAD(P)H-dependent oxidoreductase [Anaeromicropila herbilytica]BCN29407.1 NAD(P)H dehydrogenase [Anaeromicropila herbilytica]
MNHLIVFAHPNPKSFNKSIVDTIEKVSKEKGEEVTIRDLYDIGFDPVLKPSDFEALQNGSTPEDIRTEQEFIRTADIISFVYPIWWTGMPAILKGYVDRVFSSGFAYDYVDGAPKPLLTGKRGLLFSTSGSPNEPYTHSGMHKSMKQTTDEGIFGFTGIEVINHAFFGAVPSATEKMLQDDLIEVENIIKSTY